jgi:hypothetical protein
VDLLNPAPDILEEILSLPRTTRGRDAVTERQLRPLARTPDWREQLRKWAVLRRNLPGRE